MTRSERAGELFAKGYNCAQSVAVAFSDLIGLEPDAAARMLSGFGGGMGRMREVCGAVSGMIFVLGCVSGYDSPNDRIGKRELYGTVQALAARFRATEGSIVCRDILKDAGADRSHIPSERTPEYYRTRGCRGCVERAAGILEEHLKGAREESAP